MPRIEFLPAGITVEVDEGTLIHDASLRAGITELELPCGGEGACGQCLVEILEAERSVPVLACRTRINRDLRVRLPRNRDTAMCVVGDSHFLVSRDVLPDPRMLTPLYRVLRLTVPAASIEEHYSDWRRLTRELTQAAGNLPVEAGLPVLRALAGALREQDGRVTVGVAVHAGALRIEEIRPGHVALAAFGLAVDIGTTTIAAQLVDLSDGRVLANAASYNQQIRRGADVISRIDYARTAERQAELRRLVLDTINGLLAKMLAEAAVDARDVRAAFIAGNTAMIHLALGLAPRHIREAPYVPTVNPAPALAASEAGLDIHPDAVVEFAPGVGSYVGGDITCGLLSTELAADAERVYLFLDIGTNGEIVIGNAEWMVGCACSAGPAFEGAGIQCGMRAAPGAIEQVELRDGGREAVYITIGGGKPAGICGSGLICLLGELFRSGVIDAAGHFNAENGGRRAFLIECAANTETGGDLVLTEADIENLIRTKAAIYAACTLILESVGLAWDAIARVYIAGGFGRSIRLSETILIGMLPDLPHGRFSYIGNSSLTGAYIALLSEERRLKLAEIAGRITYLDLSSDPRYMDAYVKAMFLPHTDAAQFPSVQKRLRSDTGVIS